MQGMNDAKIKGFRKHGNKWRGQVVLDTEDACSVATEAEERKTTAGAVMRERIHKHIRPESKS